MIVKRLKVKISYLEASKGHVGHCLPCSATCMFYTKKRKIYVLPKMKPIYQKVHHLHNGQLFLPPKEINVTPPPSLSNKSSESNLFQVNLHFELSTQVFHGKVYFQNN